MWPVGLFALPAHLARLSKTGDPLEVLNPVVDFEQFRESLERAPRQRLTRSEKEAARAGDLAGAAGDGGAEGP